MADDDNWDDAPSTSTGKFDYSSMNKFGGASESNADENSGGFGRDKGDGEVGGFRGRGGRGGGFRGRGGGGGFNRDSNNDDDGGSNSRGGFQSRRGGFNRDNNDDNGGGSGGRGGFAGRRGGFNRDGNDGDGGSRDGGFGGRGGSRGRGGGGFRSNNDDEGNQGNGFRDRRNNDGNATFGDNGQERGRGRRDGFGKNRDEGNNDDDGGAMDKGVPEERKVPLYIPEEPSNDESVIFGDRISAGINFSQYQNIKVNVNGKNPVPPIASFEECNFKNLIMENIKKSGYTEPTPIQKHSIPIMLAGRDLMGCAQTGSGKTMAFMLPIVQWLMANPREDVSIGILSEPRALIVSPTRELTIQIFEQARKLARDSVLKICLAYGGAGSRHQGNKISAGCDILVGTTGRLVDFMNKGIVRFSSIKFLVLDEADRMLDMGFLPDMAKIGDHETMPKSGDRQTVMFSATFPKAIQEIAARFLHNYLFVCVGIVGGACLDIEQTFIEVSHRDKKAKFFELMEELKQEGKVEGILVFVGEKRNTDIYASLLSQKGYLATSLHGDRYQQQREQAVREFKSGQMKVLVATSVAARGLDAKVSYVIQIDMPMDIEEYVHRIGRTGRIGNKGKAITFFNPERDGKHVEDLKQILAGANQTVPDWLSGGGGMGGGYRGDSGGFGAEDCRDFTANNKPQPMETVEAEEDW